MNLRILFLRISFSMMFFLCFAVNAQYYPTFEDFKRFKEMTVTEIEEIFLGKGFSRTTSDERGIELEFKFNDSTTSITARINRIPAISPTQYVYTNYPAEVKLYIISKDLNYFNQCHQEAKSKMSEYGDGDCEPCYDNDGTFVYQELYSSFFNVNTYKQWLNSNSNQKLPPELWDFYVRYEKWSRGRYYQIISGLYLGLRHKYDQRKY